MKKYIFISVGGFLGAITRFAAGNIDIYQFRLNIPLRTLIINVTGSFLLALLLTAGLKVWNLDADIRNGISTGFLGAYTTFSTLCKETVGLMAGGYYFSAVSYIILSAVLGLAAAYSGVLLARKLISEQKPAERAPIFVAIEETEGEAE